MGNVVKLSDYRTAKRRRASRSLALASGGLFMGAGLMAAFAWLDAMEDAADLFLVPWPGGIDDLPIGGGK